MSSPSKEGLPKRVLATLVAIFIGVAAAGPLVWTIPKDRWYAYVIWGACVLAAALLSMRLTRPPARPTTTARLCIEDRIDMVRSKTERETWQLRLLLRLMVLDDSGPTVALTAIGLGSAKLSDRVKFVSSARSRFAEVLRPLVVELQHYEAKLEWQP